jgi:hypothetical protein
MTVRLDQVSLVVRRAWLDVAFPGGSAAFVKKYRSDSAADLSVDCDDKLVTVNTTERLSLAASTASLLQIGATLAAPENPSPGEVVIVEDSGGIRPPCSWLRFVRDPDGAAFAEYHNESESSETESSRQLLGIEDGKRTWLDFETSRFECEPISFKLTLVADELRERGWSDFDTDESKQKISLSVNAGVLLMLQIQFFAFEVPDTLVFVARLPGKVEEEDRTRVGEFLLMANWNLLVGGFDLDHSDGEIVYRIGIPTTEGALSQALVSEMIDCAIAMIQRYSDGILRVVSGCSPQQIIKDIDSKPSSE